MSFDDGLLTLMNSTVHVDQLTSLSTDGYGTFVFTTNAASYPCRVVTKQVEVTNLAGEQEVANTIIWTKALSTFGVSDRLMVGGVVLGPVLRVEQYPDEDGYHHSKIYCG